VTSDDYKVLSELDKLEKLSNDYSYEMRYLSKRIRNDIWEIGINSKKLSFFLSKINAVFLCMSNIIGEQFYSLNTVIEYIKCLSKYCVFYNHTLNADYFNELINDVQLKSSERLIKQQWEDVFLSDDGYKSFISIFDDVFSHAINIHKSRFFHELSNSDALCRVVDGWGHTKERFIPRPSKTSNRWNPPGRQFLYLSFGEKEEAFSDDLTLNEYVCLEELRAKKAGQYSFCHFAPVAKGKILDLSYNDISMSQIKSIVDIYYNDSVQKIIDEMLSEKDVVQKYQDKRKLKKAVAKKVDSSIVDKSILEESFAKQYLKMICNCIYKKVDETDDAMREKAYRSFHILSQYLESKGVTGIIYPCTRTDKIKGKNLVLFNVNDAVPLPDTIREYLYI
jgi:hypothetical protein